MTISAIPRTGNPITYEFDNDLYPLNSKKRRDLARSLAADVIAFLDGLANRQVLVGQHEGRPTLAVPQADGWAVSSRRTRFTRTDSNVSSHLLPHGLLPLQDWDG